MASAVINYYSQCCNSCQVITKEKVDRKDKTVVEETGQSEAEESGMEGYVCDVSHIKQAIISHPMSSSIHSRKFRECVQMLHSEGVW